MHDRSWKVAFASGASFHTTFFINTFIQHDEFKKTQLPGTKIPKCLGIKK